MTAAAILLALPLTARSQSLGVEVGSSQAITQLVHDIWLIEDGLPQNSVRAVIQTSDGYLWLGTEEGLARYNGIGFSIFDKRSVAALRENHSIRALWEDSDGVLWIGTMGGGLVTYHKGLFARVTSDHGLYGRVISAVIEGADGELYVGTSDAGLFVGRDGTFSHLDLGSAGTTDFVRSLARDRYGAVWVGTRNGLYRINHDRVTSFGKKDGLLDNFVMSLAGDDEGSLWIGTQAGLCRYKDGQFVDYRSNSERLAHPVQSILRDTRGSIWVGLDGQGIVRIRRDQISFFDSDNGLSHDRILTLYQDREESLWIGTEGGGLNRLRSGKFTTYSTDEGLSHDMALAVYGDGRNGIWIGTEGGGLNVIRDGEIRTYRVRDGLSSDIVTSIYGGSDGELWVGTFRSGLNRFENGVFKTYRRRDGLPGDGITALAGGRNGRLWIGTDAGLAVQEKGIFRSYTRLDGLSSEIVMSILETRSGEVWVGTYDAGLNLIRDGQISAITTDDGLESNTVLALYEDAEGTVWVGTYGGGLTRVRNGVIATITTENGLFNDNVYQILEDDRGNLWMSCNKGIFYVSKEDLNRFAEGAIGEIRSVSFDKSDGLKSYELNGGFQPAGWKATDGRLWFPSVRGVVSIDPASVQVNRIPPSIVVEQVRVNGDRHSFDSVVQLAPGRHKIEFDYVGLSFIDAADVRYRYRLEGYEVQWNEAGNRRTATYTNLDPGEYVFSVMAANSDLVWSDNVATVSLRLKPAFYQTKFFWLLSIIAISVATFLAYWIRVRHLKTRQRELENEVGRRTSDLRQAKDQLEAQATSLSELYRFKTRFFNNISHELRTPLTLLLGPLENALTGAYGTMNGHLRSQLDIMLRNGRRLLRLINQLLDLAKLESGKMELRARPGDVVAFTEGIVFSFTAFAMERGIDLQFTGGDHVEELYFDPEKLEKILFNLLSNAVKFTPSGGRVDVSVVERDAADESRSLVEISVSDTGPGIPEEDLDSVFDRYHQVDGTVSQVQEGTGIGLSLARELAELHGGSIRVQSVIGSGATFVVSLPTGSGHLRADQIVTGDSERPEETRLSHVSMVEMIAVDADDGHREGAHVPAETKIVAGAPLILVVDDNRDIREYVRGCLHPDYRVVQASDGEDALQVVERIKPDVIVSDVMMPGMDGYELARRLKEDERFNNIPLILLTAKASENSKIQGLEMGIDDYMSKPFNARELRARIRNLVRIHEQEKELRELNENLERRVQDQLSQLLEDRRRYEQELIAARDRAEASARMKSTILDNVSHELRTPLTGILGYAQLLAKEVDDDHKDFATYIERSGRRLLDTLSAILDLSQLESNSVRLEPSTFRASEAVRETVDRFKGELDRKGLALSVTVPDEDLVLQLDRPKLTRILGHLVGNAVKFTERGEVTVLVHDRGQNAAFEIRDTGIGIGKDFLPELFVAFKQESSGTSRLHEGNGLGLAIAQRLVNLMYGRIDVQSKAGEGSTFTVIVPKRIGALSAEVSDRPAQPGSTHTSAGFGQTPALDNFASQSDDSAGPSHST